MIDVENLIFSRLSSAIRQAFPSNFTTSTNGVITGEKISAPNSFPAVSIVEISNTVYRRSQTVNVENHANISYEIEIYSNLSSGRKSQCKAIATVVDNAMIEINMTRIMLQPIDNATASIYRMVGRYSGVVDTTGTIYQR